MYYPSSSTGTTSVKPPSPIATTVRHLSTATSLPLLRAASTRSSSTTSHDDTQDDVTSAAPTAGRPASPSVGQKRHHRQKNKQRHNEGENRRRQRMRDLFIRLRDSAGCQETDRLGILNAAADRIIALQQKVAVYEAWQADTEKRRLQLDTTATQPAVFQQSVGLPVHVPVDMHYQYMPQMQHCLPLTAPYSTFYIPNGLGLGPHTSAWMAALGNQPTMQQQQQLMTTTALSPRNTPVTSTNVPNVSSNSPTVKPDFPTSLPTPPLATPPLRPVARRNDK